MGVYSHSRLGTFENCPLQYMLRYIDKIKPDFENTIEAFMGSMVHDTLEELYRNVGKKNTPTLASTLEDYHNRWQKQFHKGIHIVRKQFSSEYYRLKGEEFLTAYYHRFTPFNQDDTLGIETQELVPLDGIHKIHVRIDRLAKSGDVFEVHDYKTGSSLPTQNAVDADRQLGVYAYGIRHLHPNVPAENIKLVWHYLAHDTDLVSTRTDQELEVLRQKILLLIKQIETAKSFPAQTSRLCDWCGYRSKCPHFKHLYQISATESLNNFMPNAGIELVDKYAKLHEEVKQKSEKLDVLKTKLLAFARHENVEAVFGTEKKVTLAKGARVSFPNKQDVNRQQFEAVLRQIGLWDQLSTVDVTLLSKLIDEEEIHPELIKVIEPFMRKDERISVRLSNK